MAEAFVNTESSGVFRAYSAGLEPGSLNPLVVEVMQEIGIDISGNHTKSVTDMVTSGRRFHYVITVCDGASAERCPLFPGGGQRLHWGFPDPSALTGSRARSASGAPRPLHLHRTIDDLASFRQRHDRRQRRADPRALASTEKRGPMVSVRAPTGTEGVGGSSAIRPR
jgi:protein-tyrosine-phosphatase